MTVLETLLESEGRLYVLECARVAGLIVTAPLAWLNANTRTELFVDLVVEGRSGSELAVSFDDFELVRRMQ